MEGKKIQVFISYAVEDQPYYDELRRHLAELDRQEIFTVFSLQELRAGDNWNEAFRGFLDRADIILMLISSDYLASDYFQSIESHRALERGRRGQVLAIPVLIRPAMWQGLPISRHQALPKDGIPVSSWPDREQAWRLGVVEPLYEIINKLSTGMLKLNARVQDKPASRSLAENASVDQLRADVNQLIARGELDQAYQKLLIYLKEANRQSDLNDAVLLGSRIYHLDRQRTHGALSEHEYVVARAQLNHSLLSLTDHLKTAPAW